MGTNATTWYARVQPHEQQPKHCINKQSTEHKVRVVPMATAHTTFPGERISNHPLENLAWIFGQPEAISVQVPGCSFSCLEHEHFSHGICALLFLRDLTPLSRRA